MKIPAVAGYVAKRAFSGKRDRATEHSYANVVADGKRKSSIQDSFQPSESASSGAVNHVESNQDGPHQKLRKREVKPETEQQQAREEFFAPAKGLQKKTHLELMTRAVGLQTAIKAMQKYHLPGRSMLSDPDFLSDLERLGRDKASLDLIKIELSLRNCLLKSFSQDMRNKLENCFWESLVDMHAWRR